MNPIEPDTPELPPAEAEPAAVAPKPRRRRAPKAAAVEAGDAGDGRPMAVDLDLSTPAESAAAPLVASETEAVEGTEAIEGAAEAPSEGSGDEGPGAEGRRRRRNRRRGRRGADRAGAPEGGPDAEAAGDEAASGVAEGEAEATEPEPLPPTDVNELFAEVVSGAYDGGEPADTPIELAPTAAPRRVLAADPDAPKLHKVLAQSGVGSRRDLEAMIAEGRVTVNGQPSHIGQRISFGDRIQIDGKPVRVRIAPPPPRVLAYHKPVGEVVTHDDPQQRPTVFRRLPRLQQGKWQSVGRLDINTEGLLLFTNSGDLANRLMHPRFGVEREYAVRVLGTLTEDERQQLLQGVEIDGQTAAFQSIEDGGGEGVNHWYRVVITEGRNREVRKLFDTVDKAVSRLIRIRYGSVVLPRGLKRGVWVDLAGDDVKALRNATGMPRRDSQGPGPGAGAQEERRGRRGGRRGRGGRDGDDRPQPGHGDGPRQRQGPMRSGPPRDGDPGQDHGDGDFERENVGPIPNPLQQTYDKRAIQLARKQREYSEDGPIPNPLQQTYDKRAVQGERKQREYSEDGPIPNPLQQTYDKRFAQGSGPKTGGGGGGGANRGRRKPGPGQRGGGAGGPGGGQPDPMRTSVGYIGGDAFLGGKGRGGARGGKGGRGGGGGGGGGNSGGGGGGGRGGKGGGRGR